jgi:DNA primase
MLSQALEASSRTFDRKLVQVYGGDDQAGRAVGLGQGRGWVYRCSLACPKDGRGRCTGCLFVSRLPGQHDRTRGGTGGGPGVFARSDDKQRVLDAGDIVRVVGEQVALKQKGREFVGLCPFHDDHSPSMCVVPHKQIYHCFSCGAGGDVFSFVMNYHKMSFREALEHLAEKFGVTLTPWTPRGGGEATPDAGSSRADLLAANQAASGFFRAILNHPEHGRAARELVERRGLTPAMVDAFQIGAAPDKWDGLALTVASKGLSVESFRAAGLLKARDNAPGLYDAMRHRLIFPIHDQIGRVVGFGGRRINDEDEPKYLNSPESAIFDKSTTLYALHQAAQAVRVTRVAIVTEGYMDAIACHQAGVNNAVATLGTALTTGNARVLKRLCDTVVLLFDGDEAGQRAAERAVEVFFAEPVDVRIATLAPFTDAKDPDELLKRDGGREVFDRVIAGAIDPLELLFRREAGRMEGMGLSARSRAVEEFVGRLLDLGLDRIERVRYQLIVKKLAGVAGVDWDTITGAIADRRGRRRPASVGAAAPVDEVVLARRSVAAEQVLGCVLNDPTLVHALSPEQWSLIDPDRLPEGPAREIAAAVAELCIEEREPGLRAVLSMLDDGPTARAATALAQSVDRLTEGKPDLLRKHFAERLRHAEFEDLARVKAAAAGPSDPQQQAEAIAKLRETRATLGVDRRKLPRPAS